MKHGFVFIILLEEESSVLSINFTVVQPVLLNIANYCSPILLFNAITRNWNFVRHGDSRQLF